ncbi:hypothetical protein ACIQK6_05910 [Streptomyces sp. NPDC091682]|uniref:DUF7405 family protein n=1 Tax=Streptomyces sp. NPDC091682 TaxID=3366005 RepID=UPI00381A2DA4
MRPWSATGQRRFADLAVQGGAACVSEPWRPSHRPRVQALLRWLGRSQTLAGRPQPSPPLTDLLSFTSARAMFTQIGLPRKLADEASLSYAFMVNPRSPMWMGFADQQTAGTAAADTVTFRGSSLTTAKSGSYFDHGAVQQLSHVLMDLQQFYGVDDAGVPGDDASFTERVQYMFRSTPPPSPGNADQITDGGGPAFLPNTFQGTDDALLSAQGRGTPDGERRIGHLSCLQRSSRTADGRPLHVRMDGPGYAPWTYRTDPPSPSWSSRCSSRVPTSSPRCAGTRPRSTWRRPTASRRTRTGWSGS